MRPTHFLGSFLLIFFLSIGVAAQGRPTGGGGGGGGGRPAGGGGGNIPGNVPNTNIPNINNNPNLNPAPVLFLSGKVRIDDGSEITDPATIESVCNGERHFEGYTDRKGNFSFEFGKQRDMATDDVTTSIGMPNQSRSATQQRRELQECELVAVLPGFTSQMVELSGMDLGESSNNVGTIVLHRLAKVQGFTISATTAMAPSKARKAYDKGRDEERKKKWDGAQKKFAEAVQIYPRFAVAWLELARTQIEQNDNTGARQSLQHALAADAQFVSPHDLLALLDFQQKDWQGVVDESGAVLRLNPLNFAQDWYYNTVGNYYLGHYDAAEKSARQGIQADVEHRVPKLEYLLGVLLAQKRDYQGAAQHMRNYVRLAPQATDVGQVNQQIAKIEKLSSNQATTQK